MRPSHRDYRCAELWPQEWLLIEWPEDKDEALKYWHSTMPTETTIAALVDTAKLRWRIVPEARLRHDERDFQELKQEIGLDYHEGRGWRGFHHHAALSIAAYGFLVAVRSPIPPSAPIIRALWGKVGIEAEGYRPRGAAPAS